MRTSADAEQLVELERQLPARVAPDIVDTGCEIALVVDGVVAVAGLEIVTLIVSGADSGKAVDMGSTDLCRSVAAKVTYAKVVREYINNVRLL